MRSIFILLLSACFLSSGAQTLLPSGGIGMPLPGFSGYHSINDSSRPGQKWHLNSYSSVAAGYLFFNGAGASYLAVPMGLQLTRQLNNNVYAFAGASVSPAYINFNHAFTNQGTGASYPGGPLYNPYKFGMTGGVEMGLMYINDAKTFSISGSIGVERGSFPVYQNNVPRRKK